jgi:cell pole-organizing protein PopZ
VTVENAFTKVESECVLGPAGLDVKVEDILANVRKSVDSDMDSLSGGTASQSRGTLMRGALREMRISMGAEVEDKPHAEPQVSDLRSRIKKKMAAMESESTLQPAKVASPSPKPLNAVVPARGDFSDIMSRAAPRSNGLRTSFAESDTRDDLRYAPPSPPQRAQHWVEPEPQVYEEYAEPDPYQQQPDPYGQDYGYEEQAYAPPYQHALEAPLISPQTEAHAETAFRQLSDAILARATGDRNLEDMTRDMLKGMLKQWLDANLPTIVEELVREEIQRVARRGR